MWSQLARGVSSASRERTPLSQSGVDPGSVRQLRRRSDHKPPLSASLLVGIQDYTAGYKPNRQGLALHGRPGRDTPEEEARIASLSSYPNAARPDGAPPRHTPASRPLAKLRPRDSEAARDVGTSAQGGLLGDYADETELEDEVFYDEDGGELHPVPPQAQQDYDAEEGPIDYDDQQEEEEEVPLAVPRRAQSTKGSLASAALIQSLEADISPTPGGSQADDDDELPPSTSFAPAKRGKPVGRAVVLRGAPATPEASDDSRDSFALGFPSVSKGSIFAHLSAGGPSRGVVRPRSPSLDTDDRS